MEIIAAQMNVSKFELSYNLKLGRGKTAEPSSLICDENQTSVLDGVLSGSASSDEGTGGRR